MVQSSAATPEAYIAELEPERAALIGRVRDLVNSALPAVYQECMSYGAIGWVIPLEAYPDTYNGQPLGYAGLAAQKNYGALYLNCVYASAERNQRLKQAWAAAGKKLQMGKSCLRFKRLDDLALDVLRDEIASTTPDQFIAIYEASRSRSSS